MISIIITKQGRWARLTKQPVEKCDDRFDGLPVVESQATESALEDGIQEGNDVMGTRFEVLFDLQSTIKEKIKAIIQDQREQGIAMEEGSSYKHEVVFHNVGVLNKILVSLEQIEGDRAHFGEHANEQCFGARDGSKLLFGEEK